jgi:hypothetical protein
MTYNNDVGGRVQRALAGKEIFTKITFMNPIGREYDMFDLKPYEGGKLVYEPTGRDLHPRLNVDIYFWGQPIKTKVPISTIACGLDQFRKEVLEEIDPPVVERLRSMDSNHGITLIQEAPVSLYSEDLYKMLVEKADRLFPTT